MSVLLSQWTNQNKYSDKSHDPKAKWQRARLESCLKSMANMKFEEVKLRVGICGMRAFKAWYGRHRYWFPDGIKFRRLQHSSVAGALLPKALVVQNHYLKVFLAHAYRGYSTQAQVNWLRDEWERRSTVPGYDVQSVGCFTHICTSYDPILLYCHHAMQVDSVFRQYERGMNKNDYWGPIRRGMPWIYCTYPRLRFIFIAERFKNQHI